MFLSRFQLNPQRRGAHKLLSSPHALHAAVLAAFPDAEATQDGRVLWRLDTDGPRAVLWVSSPREPDFTHLAEQAGWPGLQSGESRPYETVLDRLADGQNWTFRITANPVRNVRGESQARRGKPLGHVTVEQQEKWLLDRQEAAGFRVVADETGSTLRVTDRRTLNFRKGDVEVTLRVASFEGVLTITDRGHLVRTLTHGLGRAKGYGCGLLTLAPVV